MTELISPTKSICSIDTPNAQKYLQQLCKHFAHKIQVSFDKQAGKITFPMGECRLAADETMLTMTVVTPDNSEVERLQDIIAQHLARFAFREYLNFTWHAV